MFIYGLPTVTLKNKLDVISHTITQNLKVFKVTEGDINLVRESVVAVQSTAIDRCMDVWINNKKCKEILKVLRGTLVFSSGRKFNFDIPERNSGDKYILWLKFPKEVDDFAKVAVLLKRMRVGKIKDIKGHPVRGFEFIGFTSQEDKKDAMRKYPEEKGKKIFRKKRMKR